MHVVMWLALALITMPAISQYTLSGVVLDEQNDPLQGANLIIEELNRGTITFSDGSFSMGKVREGLYNLKVTFVGYETYRREINVSSDLELGKVMELVTLP